jgi:hypothetical protein
MSRNMRAYYYGVLGAIGGAIGWQISNLTGLSFTPNVYLSEIVVGGLIGCFVGLLIGASEGLITRQPARALKAGGLAALLGLVAGAVGLPLGELLFQILGANLIGRAFGWALFGLCIGVAEGLSGGSQLWKGALGGLLGGLIGGLLLEVSRLWLADALVGKAAGLVLLGASVGALIALVAVLLSRAWLEVASGKLKGSEFILDKFVKAKGPKVILGSDALKSDIAFPDPDIAPQHAMLSGNGTHFLLRDMSIGGTFVDGRRVELAQLADRQRIRLGNTELVYHEKR